MLQTLTSASALSAAQRDFAKGFSDSAVPGQHVVGFKGGSEKVRIYWREDVGIWGSFNDVPLGELKVAKRLRYWNAFGTQDPSEHGSNLLIICEVNSPHDGIYRRVGGIYAEDTQTSQVVVLHRGTMGGGRTGISKAAFWQHWDGPTVDVTEDGSTSKCALVCKLGDPNLPSQIAQFVKRYGQIKAQILDR